MLIEVEGDILKSNAQAIAQAAGRTLVGIVHVCGAPDDPQGFELQCQVLRDQGMILADSNAQAVRLAAAVLGGPVLGARFA